jgi:hypothetical protein
MLSLYLMGKYFTIISLIAMGQVRLYQGGYMSEDRMMLEQWIADCMLIVVYTMVFITAIFGTIFLLVWH